MPFLGSVRGTYGGTGRFGVKGPLAPVWVTTSIPAYTGASASYSYTFTATDDSGDQPTITLVSGATHAGFSISSAGVMTGTVTTAGTYNFTLRATDINGQFVDQAFSWGVTIRTPATYSVSAAAALSSYVAGDVVSIGYTGGEQTIFKKNAATWRVQLYGGSGSDGDSASRGGGGGRVNGDMAVSQSAYYVHIGGAGARSGSTVTGIGGYNGGGNLNGDSNTSWYQSGGGGASDMRTVQGAWNANTSNRILVAGGGGAGSRNGGSGAAGPGAYPDGIQSSQDGGGGSGSNANGRGGTQNAGGAPGQTGSIGSLISAGFNQGGGYTSASNVLSGAGGSGWYGGGVGSFHMGLGGGGSSYYNSGVISNFGHTTGTQGVSATNGSGSVTILTTA